MFRNIINIFMPAEGLHIDFWYACPCVWLQNFNISHKAEVLQQQPPNFEGAYILMSSTRMTHLAVSSKGQNPEGMAFICNVIIRAKYFTFARK